MYAGLLKLVDAAHSHSPLAHDVMSKHVQCGVTPVQMSAIGAFDTGALFVSRRASQIRFHDYFGMRDHS
jgi:hypothetical protein